MTFKNKDGVLIIEDGERLIASTPSHTIEKNGDTITLTFNATGLQFTDNDISFDDLVKLLPK